MKGASLQKKCFECQNVLCACCASNGCCRFTCVMVHVSIYVAMNVFGMCMCITCCDVKKNLEMSIQYLQRATFTIKKEVGGRELTKLWVYGLVL